MTRSIEDLLPLRCVEVDVLLSTVDEARHGYAILQDAEERSGGRPGYEIPTLYRALHRMRDAGLVGAAPAPAEADPRRDYWRATPLGREVLRAELKRLDGLVSAGRLRLGMDAGRGSP